MSAVLISALTNPAVDALAVQLIGQGIDYFQGMAARKAAGLMTESDVAEMSKKLDLDYDSLLESRRLQIEREAKANKPPEAASTSSTDQQVAALPPGSVTHDELKQQADTTGDGKAK